MNDSNDRVIKNVDKRTARREQANSFSRAIQQFRQDAPCLQHHRSLEEIANSSILVCVRKRPIFPHEIRRGEFDVISCQPNLVTVHDCRMHADMLHKFMRSVSLEFDRVFSEQDTTEDIFAEIGKPFVEFALNGKTSTCFMFGQTGSGKTYTISAMHRLTARELFCDNKIASGERKISISCFEIAGTHVYDLLNDQQEVFVREDAQGTVHIRGGIGLEMSSVEDVYRVLEETSTKRATHSTQVNMESSRTHAIVRFHISNADKQMDDTDGPVGTLLMVDLAGSERKEDSMYHDAERRKEGEEINTSLNTLKECLRIRALNTRSTGELSHIPYRRSVLTRVLKDSITGNTDSCMTILIATVSPNACDTEHSLNTLRHAALMASIRGENLQEDVQQQEVVDVARETKEEMKGEVIFFSLFHFKPIYSL